MDYIDFNEYIHVGLVVENIENTIRKMKKIYKIDEYRINDFPPDNIDKSSVQLMYQGERTTFSARFCFIKMGNTEMELIEPTSGKSIWSDFLQEKGEGVHHLKYHVTSVNDAIRLFREKGIQCIQYGSAVGPNTGKTWAYFDTTDELGYVIEILNTQNGEVVSH